MVTHYADCSHRGQEDHEGLADFRVLAGGEELLHVNRVGLLEARDPVAGHVVEDADPEPRSREWVAHDAPLRKPELAPELAYLVLEEEAKRLAELHLHPRRQASDVVVRLDRRSGPFEACGLNDVGIQGSLEKIAILREVQALDGGFELLDEEPADDLTLLLRLGYVLQLGVEDLRCINDFELESVDLLLQPGFHLGGLVVPQQPGVDHERIEAVTESSANQSRADARVDPAADR